MDRLRTSLATAAGESRLALVPFVTAGFPDPTATLDLLCGIDAVGVDGIELGIPFSDPLADGPTIQRTSQIALDHGFTVGDTLELVRRFRQVSSTPIVIMTYANPILRYGLDRFCDEAVEAGVEAMLLTDVPPDELKDAWTAFDTRGLGTVQLVAPTTTPDRIPYLVSRATGFVYCVSRTGVTGKGKEFASNLVEQIDGIRAASSLPVLVGFGVRAPADVEAVRDHADGVVVGAAVLEPVLGTRDVTTGIAEAAGLLTALRGATTRRGGT